MGLLLLLALLWQPPASLTVGGTVRHSLTGKPLAKVRVSLEAAQASGQPRICTTGTDGRFRFDGVAAGKYALSAQRLGFVPQAYKQRALYQVLSTAVVVGEDEKTDELVFNMLPGAVIQGVVTDADGLAIPYARVAAFKVAGVGAQRRILAPTFAYTDDRGHYRIHSLPSGSFLVAYSGEPWYNSSLPANVRAAYPATFYPGVTRPEAAATIRLKPGQEVQADAVLNPVPSVLVTGTVQQSVAETGRRVVLSVPLTTGAGGGMGAEMPLSREGTLAGGMFRIEGVPAGRYVLSLGASTGVLLGRRWVDIVAPETVLKLEGMRPPQVTARVRTLQPPREAADQTILALRQVDGLVTLGWPVDRDGRVSFPSVPPGRYEVAAASGRTQHAVLAVKASGASVSGNFVDIPDGGMAELDVVTDAAATVIDGRVLREGKPQAAVLVLLVPRSDIEKLGAYRYDQSDSDGSFTWRGVARGEYMMFAVEEGEASDYMDPQAIQALLPAARPVTVTGEPHQSVTLEMPAR